MSQRAKNNKRASVPSAKMCSKSQELTDNIGQSSTEEDFARLSVSELVNEVLVRNRDPVIEKIMYALISKLPQEMSEQIEVEKRREVLLLSGSLRLPEISPPRLNSATSRKR